MEEGTIGESLQNAIGKGLGNLNSFGSGLLNATQTIPSESMRKTGQFCASCGAKLPRGAGFCPGCGAKVGEGTSAPNSVAQGLPDGRSRQSRFDGGVLKCPGCGATINATNAVCPECGLQLSGRAVVGSVQEFANKLLEIEQGRSGIGMLGNFLGMSSSIDEQKKTLISTFPIPNTVEEITEFMYLALSNIDVRLSKKGLFSAWKRGSNEAAKKELSDTWVAKMQQVYLKAERSFPSDPAFKQIRRLYLDKMAELNMRVE